MKRASLHLAAFPLVPGAGLAFAGALAGRVVGRPWPRD
jgi:hypothetical protein